MRWWALVSLHAIGCAQLFGIEQTTAPQDGSIGAMLASVQSDAENQVLISLRTTAPGCSKRTAS